MNRLHFVYGSVICLLFQSIAESNDKKEALPLFKGLGSHSRKVTDDPEAQRFFDQGLAFFFAFNHDEAIRSFEAAAKQDPKCAMAYWGIAIANGLHINKPVVDIERAKKAHQAIQMAKSLQKSCAPGDQALIEALSHRYPDPLPEDRNSIEKRYSRAMKDAWEAHPKDADIGALYAESRMNLRPWDLWTSDGKPQPETLEIISTLESVLALNEQHPLALHLYIHAVEASPTPDKALKVADRLRHLQPGLGHMVHMPSHIDVRTGNWNESVSANIRAIEADRQYLKRSPKQDFYHLYMAHNHHMLAFSAMMQGQSKLALSSVRSMIRGIPAEWVAKKENAAIADGFLASPYEVMIRFGLWDEMLREEIPAEAFPIARSLFHYARGVAFAAKGENKKARECLADFREEIKKTAENATFGNNRARDLYHVADPMLEGEILAAEGKIDDAIKYLKLAVQAEDQLRYDEPPDWILPVRHALGAWLLKANRPREAEAVYGEDLKKWPRNGWSLHGLSQSLELQGKSEEAGETRKQFQRVWQFADCKIPSSCFCVDHLKKGK